LIPPCSGSGVQDWQPLASNVTTTETSKANLAADG
jgi:hypothetical protein